MNGKRIILSFCFLLVLGLAACSPGATPQLISSYPRTSTPVPYPPPGRVYDTSLSLEVSDVDSAAQQAQRLVNTYGGYLASSQSWYTDGRLHTALTLVVSAGQFDSLRQSLLALGRLVDEQLTSRPAPQQIYPQPQSTLAVTFIAAPQLLSPPTLPDLGWSPARTFSQAFAVFAAIATFLINVLIWISVVVGPFVLLGLGLRWLYRRIRQMARRPAP